MSNVQQPEFQAFCNRLLNEGRHRFDLSLGIISRIKNNDYHIIAVQSDANVFVTGETFNLQETYCRQVVDFGVTVALTQIDGIRGLQLHPLYEALALEAYISTPLCLDNKIWGTLNFSSLKKRKHDFTLQDCEWIEAAARQIACRLTPTQTSI
jgi:transcriptional regulator with GAF, ATPase, and Fis domain